MNASVRRPASNIPGTAYATSAPSRATRNQSSKGSINGNREPGAGAGIGNTYAPFTNLAMGRAISQRQPGGDAAFPHARAVRVDEPGEPGIDPARSAETR